jgi:hypothetical protein
VQAGIAENVIVPEFDVAPADAAENAIVCRAYEPPVTSVPAADADDADVANANFIAPVGAV